MRPKVLITKPDGEVIDLDAHTIRVTPLEVQPMPDETPTPRPTKAAIEQLTRERDQALATAAGIQADLARALEDRDAWRAARVTDDEAEAISGCVRALDALIASGGRNTGGGYAVAMPSRQYVPDPRETPVGRVLLHLSGRYGVPLVPMPPPEIDPEEMVTMTVPRRIAESIQHTW